MNLKYLHSLSRLLLLIGLILPLSSAAGEGPCEEGKKNTEKKKVIEGIEIYRQECDHPTYKAHIVEVDLTSDKYEFFVTPYKQRRLVTSKFAERFDAVLAVNGGFWCKEGGFNVSGKDIWPKFGDTKEAAVVGFGKYDEQEGKIKVDIRPPEEILTTVPGWMDHALTGIPLILENGNPQKADHWIFGARHPRTGIGYTKDGKKLFIVVVDGRKAGWSLGMKTLQLGQLFLELGADRAVNLDGGSSSTLVIPSMGGLINKTCFKKGPERNVPNHLGIIRTVKKQEGGEEGKNKVKSALQKLLAAVLPIGLLRSALAIL